MTTLFIVLTVCTMTAVVFLASGVFSTVSKRERMFCPHKRVEADVLIRRRSWPGGYLGRPLEVEGCSALTPTDHVTCDKSCIGKGDGS